jgi:acyl dehydratase
MPPEVVRVGESFQTEAVFSLDSIRAFAASVGDFNPLHHDLAAAKASRHGEIIASGT